jgi:cyclase
MKKRIIPATLLTQGSQVSLSREFDPWRVVGSLTQNLRLHVRRSCDELLIINPFIDNVSNLQKRFFQLVVKETDIPISYVGGIRTVNDALFVINSGFDKVYITSAFLDDPVSLPLFVDVLGSQSIGVSLPYVYINNIPYVWDHRTKKVTSFLLVETINHSISLGVGEILLHSVANDGLLTGNDKNIFELLNSLPSHVPFLLAGGFSTPENIHYALSKPTVSGVVASSIFVLTEHTPRTLRQFCSSRKIPMRSSLF